MSGNAYRCFQCGKVESERAVEQGAGQWISIRPLSLVLLVAGRPIRDEEPLCSPDCVAAVMADVKRVP